jgi:opacity protein-like surface antigen
MKKAAAVLGLALGVCAAAPAGAQLYWRLDIGYSEAVDKADFKDNNFYESGNIVADDSFTQPATLNNIDGSSIIAGGVGYRFTSGLRADVTLAYRGFYTLNDKTFEADYHANIASTTLMVNGYYDFGSGGIRPYIGVGIGVARNRTDSLIQDFRLGFSNSFSGATREDPAFALMAGIGIPYSGWTLDIGYRYIDMGKFETGTSARLGITGGHTGKLSAHEFTLGARF